MAGKTIVKGVRATPEFWEGMQAAARARNIPLNTFIVEAAQTAAAVITAKAVLAQAERRVGVKQRWSL